VAAHATHVVDAIQASGGQAEALEADLRDPATPARLFDAAEAAFGQLEILINNGNRRGMDTFIVSCSHGTAATWRRAP